MLTAETVNTLIQSDIAIIVIIVFNFITSKDGCAPTSWELFSLALIIYALPLISFAGLSLAVYLVSYCDVPIESLSKQFIFLGIINIVYFFLYLDILFKMLLKLRKS